MSQPQRYGTVTPEMTYFNQKDTMRWGHTWPTIIPYKPDYGGGIFLDQQFAVGVAMASDCGVVLELKVQQCV